MNPRLTAAAVGTIILVLGLTGLLAPDFARVTLLGFTADPARLNAVNGEVRATYGGFLVVMGLVTLLAAMDPVAHRARLRFIGLLWWGACAGRLLGAYLDGDPGLFGWLAAGVELVVGGALFAATLFTPRAPEGVAAQVSTTPTAAS
jgi:hypothetical protein